MTRPPINGQSPRGVDRNSNDIKQVNSNGFGLQNALASSSRLDWDMFPSVEDRVENSTEVWARELRSLFDHAKERFGDVSWESEGDGFSGQLGDRVWGHKAVIYARAPKAFKDRYFITRPMTRSPTSLSSSSPHLLPPLFPSSRPSTPPSSFRRPSPIPGRSSSLSVDTFQSEGTIRASGDVVMRLTHGDTPELFRAQLEWLYTGEGFGDVVEWISAEDDSGMGGSIRDSLGRRGNIHERRDKLGQDLTYMWRSKLYADVRIHLDSPGDSEQSGSDNDSDDSIDSLSSTAIFPSHKFVLASRSPYFASLLLNPSSFQTSSTADIHLPTLPFTPAALHFCLGYMYAGHLDFSNRTFDLLTSFQIHRAASYLQLDTLIDEIEARIVWDFCHGLDYSKCHCKKCSLRAGRVWKFASAPDVGAVVLAKRARRFLVRGWGESWGRDIATADQQDRDSLVAEVQANVTSRNAVSVFKSVEMVKARMEYAIRLRGRDAAVWVENLERMLEEFQDHLRQLLMSDFPAIAEGQELWDLVSGKGFNDDLLENIGKEIVNIVSSSQGCVEGPRIYQALVSSILLKVDPATLQTALPMRSRGRQQVEQIKEGVVGHIRRRWMQVRDTRGFDSLENWALKEISDEIEIPVDDLLSSLPAPQTPKKAARFAHNSTPSSSRASPRSALPEPRPRPSASDGASVRSTATRQTTASVASQPSTLRAGTTTPPDPSGLRRLRLSSSASTVSSASRRSPASRPRPPTQTAASTTGPQARSPTAARQGPTVPIGPAAAGRTRPPRASSPTASIRTNATAKTTATRSMSGPLRPLVTRPVPGTKASGTIPTTSSARTTPSTASTPAVKTTGTSTTSTATSAARASKPTPSITSVRSTNTAKTPQAAVSTSTTRVARPPVPPVPPVPSTADTGPSRLRTTSASTTGSVRSRVASINANASKTAAATAAPGPRVKVNGQGRTASTPVVRPPVPPIPTSRVTSVANGRKTPEVTKATAETRLRTASASTTASMRSRAPSIAPSIASRTTVTTRAPGNAAKPTPTAKGVTKSSTVALSKVPLSSSTSVDPKPETESTSESASAALVTNNNAKSPQSPAKQATSAKSPETPSSHRIPTSKSASPAKASGLSTTASARIRNPSVASTSSVRSRMQPPTQPLKPVKTAPPPSHSNLSKASVRSPSSSTTEDGSEARTPRLSSGLPAIEPIIRRDGSDVSEMGSQPASSLTFSSSPTKAPMPIPITLPPPPPVTIHRIPRKVSSSSTRSAASFSSRNYHPASAFDPPRRSEPLPGVLAKKSLEEGLRPFEGKGVSLNIGVPCIVSLDKRRVRFKACIKYIGHLDGSKGPWVGVEVEDSDRLGVETLPSGSKDGLHYFHKTDLLEFGHNPSPAEQEVRHNRQRRIESIREGLKRKPNRNNTAPGSGNSHLMGLGLGLPPVSGGFGHNQLGVEGLRKRSTSPFVGDWGIGSAFTGFENPRVLFVRPSDVVFVIGAE